MGPAVHKEHLEKNLEEVQVLGGTGSEKDWSDDYWRSKIRFSVGTRPAYLVLSAKVEYILVCATTPRLGPRNVSREPGATPFASRRSRRM